MNNIIARLAMSVMYDIARETTLSYAIICHLLRMVWCHFYNGGTLRVDD